VAQIDTQARPSGVLQLGKEKQNQGEADGSYRIEEGSKAEAMGTLFFMGAVKKRFPRTGISESRREAKGKCAGAEKHRKRDQRKGLIGKCSPND